jgi:transposase
MLHSNEKIIQNKVGLLDLANELQNISKACKLMGLSRETFYRYKHAIEEGGVSALIDKSRRKPNLLNRVDSTIEQAVLDHAVEFPSHGQAKTSHELKKKGIVVSPSGVRSIWLRHHLESFKKRLAVLENKSTEEVRIK